MKLTTIIASTTLIQTCAFNTPTTFLARKTSPNGLEVEPPRLHRTKLSLFPHLAPDDLHQAVESLSYLPSILQADADTLETAAVVKNLPLGIVASRLVFTVGVIATCLKFGSYAKNIENADAKARKSAKPPVAPVDPQVAKP
ncbi:hypothetical protein TrRE_jg5956, partial [Triparma retinervis]